MENEPDKPTSSVPPPPDLPPSSPAMPPPPDLPASAPPSAPLPDLPPPPPPVDPYTPPVKSAAVDDEDEPPPGSDAAFETRVIAAIIDTFVSAGVYMVIAKISPTLGWMLMLAYLLRG